MRRFRSKGKILRPVRPNAGLEAIYRGRLYALIDAMKASVDYWIIAAYRRIEPQLAHDTPADDMRAEMRRLATHWLHSFDVGAEELADFFGRAAISRTDKQLLLILRTAGIAVDFKMTPAALNIIDATIAENVALIKSIPQQYLTQVEGSVMRSVVRGRDLEGLAKELEYHYGVTKRRAAFISLDQLNKATAAINQARQIELGLFTAVWLHSHAGKKPRPKHVAVDGKVYDVRKGLKVGDKGGWVLPGYEPRCRCVSRTIVYGLT